MRKLLYSVAAVATLAFTAATPSQAKASWLSEFLHQRFDPDSAYVVPYSEPAYSYYYVPGYDAVPSYGYYASPYYVPYRS